MAIAAAAVARKEPSKNSARPFLRWAGGKQQLLPHIVKWLPEVITGTYFEPFLGGASVFFAKKPSRAHLSDANVLLIDTFRAVKKQPLEVADLLMRMSGQDCEEFYYRTREAFNNQLCDCESQMPLYAARFIYLNKTCFNGIFRVNRKGHFNVPYGFKKKPAIPSREQLTEASSVLANSRLESLGFKQALALPVAGDFIYLDPPYPALSETAYFRHYTSEVFDDAQQRRLADHVCDLSKRGVKFLLSNADTPMVRDLYSQFDIVPIPVVRFITCKAERHSVSELIIRNF